LMTAKRITAATLVAVFCIIAGCALPGTPRDSLSRLRTALLNHDADAALRYIDVDSITECLVEDLLSRHGASGDVGAAVGRSMQPFLLPVVKEAVKKQVKRAISSTDDNGYFNYIRKAHVFYLNVTMEADGRALVEPKGKSDIAFRMTRTDQGYWKVVELILRKNEKKRGVGYDDRAGGTERDRGDQDKR
jgi:hypothetical protein